MRRAIAVAAMVAAGCSGSSDPAPSCSGSVLRDWVLQSFSPTQPGADAPNEIDLGEVTPDTVFALSFGGCRYSFTVPSDAATHCAGSLTIISGMCPTLNATYSVDSSGRLVLADQYGIATFAEQLPAEVAGTWSGAVNIDTYGALTTALDGSASLTLIQHGETITGAASISVEGVTENGAVSGAVSGLSIQMTIVGSDSNKLTAYGSVQNGPMVLNYSGTWDGQQVAGSGSLTRQ